MTSKSFLSRYTPSAMAHETLEAILVQRHALAKELVDQVRESALTASKHYVLLVGPRGIGKTHLVSLVYHRVKKDAELADRILVAWLREEEWGITSFLDLLLRILRSLESECAASDTVEPCDHLAQLPADQAELKAERLLREKVGDKALLIIAENLDEIFKGLATGGQEKLRAYIQNDPVFTLLATSRSLFSGVSVRTSAFYGFFETHYLREFLLEDAVCLLAKIAEQEGDEELAGCIRTPLGRARIRAVHHLAAGNPRVYVIFSQFLSCASLDQLVDPLVQTLDDLTPYYQSRMNYLSPQQRKIVNFLLDQRGAVPVNDIAQKNLLKHQTTSSQLKKLRDMGYVRATHMGRESYYELREPLMRISLEVKKYRGEPARLLVDFLRIWYSQRELTRQLGLLKADAAYERACIAQALRAWEDDSADPRMAACLKDYKVHFDEAEYDRALQVAEELIQIRGYPSDWMKLAACQRKQANEVAARESESRALEVEPETAGGWSDRASVLNKLHRYEDALAAADRALGLDSGDAVAWFWRGLALDELGRPQDAILSYDKALELNLADTAIWNNRGVSLIKLGRPNEALQSCEKAVELKPDVPLYWYNHANALGGLGRFAEALESAEKALALKADDPDSWYAQAKILYNLGRFEGALASFDKALELSPNDSGAWYNRGTILIRLWRFEESLASFDKVVELEPENAVAWIRRGVVLGDLGRTEDALGASERALALDPADARTWGNRGVALSSLGRHDEALASFDKALQLDAAERDFQTCSNRAVVVMLLGRWEEGRTALSQAVRILPDAGGADDAEVAMVRNMLIRTRDRGTWRKHITVWLEMFDEHGVVSALGQGLVRSIRALSIPWITPDAARAWFDVWQELGGHHRSLLLPLRLLDAAVRYHQKPDERILLGLPSEEREILRPLLGIHSPAE